MATLAGISPASQDLNSQGKVYVFGPKPLLAAEPMPEIRSRNEPPVDQGSELALSQTPTTDHKLSFPDAPSTPIPPVPLQSEIAAALADAASTSAAPTEVPGLTTLATTPLPERSTETPTVATHPLALKQSGIPLLNASNPRIIPNSAGESPANQSKEKKHEGWKATPPERRKTITMENKTPRS